jgi:predicted DNA-binding protein with PD1-like motif
MRYERLEDGFYRVKLEYKDEIIESLKSFAREHNIKGAFIQGIGAGEDFELGWFSTEKREYKRTHLVGDFEIVSLSGNIGVAENGEPVVHAHICLAGEDYECLGGHLFRGVISVTAEILVVESQSKFLRKKEPESNLQLWHI